MTATHHYRALATNGDGTVMTDKKMARETGLALERLRASGRRLILATGENPGQLEGFPNLHLYDLVVAENGAALYWPGTKDVRLLAEPPAAEFARVLARRGVDPVSPGRVIVCTKRPHEPAVRAVIGEMGLGWELAFNRDDLMAVPAGVSKATGMAAAVAELGLSADEVVGVGDGENDGPLLAFCGVGVAVANGVPALKRQADVVTEGGAGAGPVELIGLLLGGRLPAPRRRAAG